MSRASEAFATSAAPIDAGARQDRPDAPAGVVRTPAAMENGGAYSGNQAANAEAIIGALVNQYFRCSTSMSGIFFCW